MLASTQFQDGEQLNLHPAVQTLLGMTKHVFDCQHYQKIADCRLPIEDGRLIQALL